MKIAIRYIILALCGFLCLAFDCRCPFDLDSGFEVWTVYPENGAIIHEPQVELIWSFMGSADVFYSAVVWVGTSPDTLHWIKVTYPFRQHPPDTTCLMLDLEPSTTYYWYIRATYFLNNDMYAEDEKHESSEIAWFTTADELLEYGQALNPYPDSGATHVDSILTMYWSFYNPHHTDYDFDVYLGTTTDPPLVDIGLEDTTRSLDTLAGGTTYYWKVVSYSGTDTVESNLWQFTTTRYPTGTDIFALLEVDARQASSGYHVEENIRARFDRVFSIDPVQPLRADSVYCQNIKLNWSDIDSNYSYTEFSMPFIENGQAVDFRIYGNAEVPDLNTGIVFPACTLSIISPESFETVSIDGFEVTWNGSGCGTNIWITLLLGADSTGVMKVTENDGIDSLTAADLAPLGGQTGTYNLVIFRQVQESIDAAGYLPQSIIRARAINVMEQIHIY